VSKGKGILQPHRILDTIDEVQVPDGSVFAEGPFLDILRSSQVRRHTRLLCARMYPVSLNNNYAVAVCVEQEAIVLPPFVAIAVRPRPGVWEFVRVNVNELNVEQLGVSEYLRFKEELVDGQYVPSDHLPCSCLLCCCDVLLIHLPLLW
jgi:sucrose synthase